MRFLSLSAMFSMAVACAPAGASLADGDPNGDGEADVVVETPPSNGERDVQHSLVLTDLAAYKVEGEWPIEPGDAVHVDVRRSG